MKDMLAEVRQCAMDWKAHAERLPYPPANGDCAFP
jgi:hypothetical protein